MNYGHTDPQAAAVGAVDDSTAPSHRGWRTGPLIPRVRRVERLLDPAQRRRAADRRLRLGPEAGEWLGRRRSRSCAPSRRCSTRCCATRSSPSPTSWKIYVAALKALRAEIAGAKESRPCALHPQPGATFPDDGAALRGRHPVNSGQQGDDPLILTLGALHHARRRPTAPGARGVYPKIAVARSSPRRSRPTSITRSRNSARRRAQWPFLDRAHRHERISHQEYIHPAVLSDGPAHPRSSPASHPQHLQRPPGSFDLWHDLRAVSREIRPRLGPHNTPGLREAWDADDLSPFHGWHNARRGRPDRRLRSRAADYGVRRRCGAAASLPLSPRT